MHYLRLSIFISIVTFIFAVSLAGETMALEKAKYSVVEKEGNFELRRYEPYVVAETMVKGDFDTVGNQGFRRLFDYISGKNRKQQSISMTAPVSQKAESEKISMTCLLYTSPSPRDA